MSRGIPHLTVASRVYWSRKVRNLRTIGKKSMMMMKRVMVGASTVKTLKKTPKFLQRTSTNDQRNLPNALPTSQQEGGAPIKGVDISGETLHQALQPGIGNAIHSNPSNNQLQFQPNNNNNNNNNPQQKSSMGGQIQQTQQTTTQH